MNIGALIATLGVDTTGLLLATAEMNKFQARTTASVASINAKLVATGAIMRKFGRTWSMFVTAPILLVGAAAAKMHMDFEASMSKIVGLVGVARTQVDAWAEDILKRAPQLAKAPKELADAMFFITSAGIRGAEAMDVLEMSAKAAASGLGETKVVADLVTSAMNAYGIETLSAAAATDVLTAAVREGKAQADVLASSMGMVLPIASNMGVQFHEVGAAIAAMTRTGTSAQTASMQLRQILAALLKPSQQAEEAFWKMGTSASALRRTIREDGLLTAMMDIRKMTNNYGEDAMAKVFPNIRALSGILDIMGANLEDNIAIFKSLENATGSTNEAFKAASKTFEFKWNVAVTSVTTNLTILGSTIAEQLLPLLKGFAERVQQLTKWFDNLDDRQKVMIVRVTALVAAIGPLSLILGVFVKSILPLFISLGAQAVIMFKALNVAMMANPITAVALAIASLAAYLLIFNRRAKETIDIQNKQSDITSQLVIDLRREQVVLNTLISAITNVNASQEARNQLIESLQRRYPSFLKNLDIETVTNTELKKRLEEINTQYRERIRLGIQEAIVAKWSKVIADNITAEAEALVGLEEARKNLLAVELRQITSQEDLSAEIMIQKGLMVILEQAVLKEQGAREGLNKTIEAAMKILAEYESSLSKSTRVTRDFTMASQNLEIEIKQILESWGLLNKAFGSKESDGLGEFQKRLLRFGDTTMMQGVTAELADIAMRNAAFGDSLLTTAQQAQFLKNRLNDLWDNGMRPGIPEMDAIINLLNELGVESNILGGILSSSFMGMANVISDSLQSTEGVLKSFGSFFSDFIKGMIFKLAAAAISAFALAIALNALGIGAGGVFKGLTSVKDLFKAGFGSFAGVGMADGGVIPSGYPNDSYPAMLSSGETVTPPGKLKSQSVNVQVSVDDIILEGENLRILLNRANQTSKMIT